MYRNQGNEAAPPLQVSTLPEAQPVNQAELAARQR